MLQKNLFYHSRLSSSFCTASIKKKLQLKTYEKSQNWEEREEKLNSVNNIWTIVKLNIPWCNMNDKKDDV